LFVALLRALGIEARQQFVDLDAGIWRGLLDLHTPFVDHSFTEVRLRGAWVATDSYIVDRPLFRAAHATLVSRRLSRGYGIVASGRTEWDGRTPSFVQFGWDDPTATRHRWGVFPDVNAFYRATPATWNRRDDVTRVIYPLAALAANHAAESLRARGPAAIRGKTRTA
jgi:transglutaminase-like putative cysteine protease